MIPQHLMPLEAMPQTNNGKIDYKALPAPQNVSTESDSRAEANTPGERLLVDVWQNVLEMDDIGAHDNFFDLGGHSLLVMQVIAEVESRTGVKLSPRDFLIGTVSQMAEQLEDACPEEAASVADTKAQQPVEQVTAASAPATADSSEKKETSKSTMKRLLSFWD